MILIDVYFVIQHLYSQFIIKYTILYNYTSLLKCLNGMDFRFHINDLFRSPLVEIDSTLIPPNFTGPRRMLYDAVTKVGEVINEMGLASARSQGLLRPLTTADKLKGSEHTVYIGIDQMDNNGRGSVAGFLRTGKKSLYAYDRYGREHKITSPYVFDFYVHENKQRLGWGKYLYDSMLVKEDVPPEKIAFDQPTPQLLNFLSKHYGMNEPVKQVSKFAVFEGFFPHCDDTAALPVKEIKDDNDDDDDEKNPVGRTRSKPKFQLVYPEENEEEMYKPKNVLE